MTTDETLIEPDGLSDDAAAHDVAAHDVAAGDAAPLMAHDGAVETTDTKRKVLMFGGMFVVLLVLGGLYLLWAQGRVSNDLAERNENAQQVVDEFEARQRADERDDAVAVAAVSPTATPVEIGPALAPGEILVVNRVPGDDYGRLAIRHTDGSRTLLDRECMRVHISTEIGVCLSEEAGLVTSFRTTFFPAVDIDAEIKSYASALPSRARISPDGTFSAVTAFVTGTSYADVGSGETTTIVTIDEIEGTSLLRGASQFEVLSDDSRYRNFAAQYWGITFAADEDEIYVTGFYEDAPEIMRGSLQEMTLEPTDWVGSCPSLSPDGKTLVFKEMRPDGGFDLVAVDLASESKWMLGETRSVDDQVEWLDNDTILYSLHPEDNDQALQPEFDIWMLDIAEGSEPELFLPNADSPAVPR